MVCCVDQQWISNSHWRWQLHLVPGLLGPLQALCTVCPVRAGCLLPVIYITVIWSGDELPVISENFPRNDWIFF